MKQLVALDASSNKITDISALKDLTSLQILLLSSNKINNIEALAGLKSLTTLYLDDNSGIKDVSALSKLETWKP